MKRCVQVLSAMLVLAALVAAMAGPVLAQVAAPHLNPIYPESIDAFNPATLPWSGPSRIGGAIKYDSTTERNTGGVNDLVQEGSGKFLGQARWVGEIFSLSAEALQIDTTYPDSTNTAEFRASMVNGAVLVGGFLSIGIGQQHSGFIIEDPSGNNPSGSPGTFEQENTLNQAGLSLEMGTGVFLGVSGGTETIKENRMVPALGQDEMEEQERDVRRGGLGYYARGDSGGFHVEIYRETKEFAEFKILDDLDEEDTSGVTFEVVFSDFLLGARKIATERNDLTGVTGKKDDQSFSLGWVPGQGLAITATLFRGETTDPTKPDVVDEDEATYVAIAWLF